MKSDIKNKWACVDCHFLVELIHYDIPDDTDSDDHSQYGRSEIKPYEIYSNNRDKIRKNDYSWFKGLLGCYQECWEEKTQEMRDGRHNTVVMKNRNKCSDFHVYEPTKSFKAAKRHRAERALLEVTKQQPQQKIESVETTLSYNKATGIFRFGNLESLAISKTAITRKRKIAEKLMEYWKNTKPCPKNELVKPLISPLPQGVVDDISAIRKALVPLKVNMLQSTDEGYSPPKEPKHFNITG
jgi:hypothetical protein